MPTVRLYAGRAIKYADTRAAALAAARALANAHYRAWALADLAPLLAGRPRETLRPLWTETLPVLAARGRQALLSDLVALAPVLAALGGEEAVGEAFRAIQDVGRWWP